MSVCERVWGTKDEPVFEEKSTDTLHICEGDGQFTHFTSTLNPWFAEHVAKVFQLGFPKWTVVNNHGDVSVSHD